MRKNVVITETRTVDHEILVDCKDDEAVTNLEVELNEYIEDCGSWEEVQGLFENVEGVEVADKSEYGICANFEYGEVEEY